MSSQVNNFNQKPSAPSYFSNTSFRHDQDDEKMQIQDPEPKTSSFDLAMLSAICLSISLELEDGKSPNAAAESTSLANPEIAFSLASLRKIDFDQLLQTHFNETPYQIETIEIKKAVSILYSTGLMNSKYRQITQDLEINISKYLNLVNKSYLSELLQKAKTILAVEDSDNSNKIFTQTGLITELIGNINEVLNLFFYLEPDFKDRIENIYTYAEYQGRPMFPNCRNRFPSFYQSLNQINHEKTLLVELRNQLMRIQTALRQKAALLLPSTDKEPIQVKVFCRFFGAF